MESHDLSLPFEVEQMSEEAFQEKCKRIKELDDKVEKMGPKEITRLAANQVKANNEIKNKLEDLLRNTHNIDEEETKNKNLKQIRSILYDLKDQTDYLKIVKNNSYEVAEEVKKKKNETEEDLNEETKKILDSVVNAKKESQNEDRGMQTYRGQGKTYRGQGKTYRGRGHNDYR
jgi:hypothetical protein